MTVRVSKPEFNLREKISELDKPTGLKGLELMRSETPQEARDSIGLGPSRKNLFINGDMRIDQRSNGSATTPSGTSYTSIDRWKAVINPGSRFFDLRMGQSVTLTGRSIAKHMSAQVNKVLTGNYDHVGSTIIYGDTDSVYYSAIPALKDEIANGNVEWDKEKAIKLYDAIGEEVNSSFPQFMNNTFGITIESGEIIVIENNNLQSIKPFPPKKPRPCVFEYIYFSRPDSILNGKTTYEFRKKFGEQLAIEDNIKSDLVVPVPDSGNAAALGYSQKTKINFDLGLIRNHYVGRTFIEPAQKIRSLGVKLKLNANKSSVKDKSIVLIDDSLVRGTTSHKIVKMLYDAGAKEIHVRIASPEIKFPDFYGVDMPTKEELLAANKSVEEICSYIGAKSLKFLSIDGLYKAMGYEKRNNSYPQLTDHYFTGDYPVEIVDELGENKITQLSLLSTGSNT